MKVDPIKINFLYLLDIHVSVGQKEYEHIIEVKTIKNHDKA